MVKREKSFLIFSLLFLLIFLVKPKNGLQAAETGSLEEAIAWGMTHSPSILTIRQEVEQIQRELVRIEAGLNWQVGLNGGVNLAGEGDTPPFVHGNDSSDQVTAGITGSKVFRGGLSLEPKLTLKKDLNSTAEPELGFVFSINQQLYPWVPSLAEQEYYRTLNTLKKAEDNLNWQTARLKLDWLEGYLNLVRLHEQLQVAETEYNVAAAELVLTQERERIGEAGRGQILSAQVGLKQAEYQRKQAANRYADTERQWLLALGLPTDYQVRLEEDNIYYRQLREEVDNLLVTAEDPEALFAMVEATHYQLTANRLDRAQLEQDWQWKQGNYRPQVITGGTYDPQGQSWTFNLNLNYQLWDGGVRRLERERHEAQLEALDREEQSLRANLNAELRNLMNDVEMAGLLLEEKNLAFEKANLETEIYRQQREAGFLTEKDWTLKQLEQKTAELGCKTAADQVFMSKLRLLHLIGMI